MARYGYLVLAADTAAAFGPKAKVVIMDFMRAYLITMKNRKPQKSTAERPMRRKYTFDVSLVVFHRRQKQKMAEKPNGR